MRQKITRLKRVKLMSLEAVLTAEKLATAPILTAARARRHLKSRRKNKFPILRIWHKSSSEHGQKRCSPKKSSYPRLLITLELRFSPKPPSKLKLRWLSPSSKLKKKNP